MSDGETLGLEANLGNTGASPELGLDLVGDRRPGGLGGSSGLGLSDGLMVLSDGFAGPGYGLGLMRVIYTTSEGCAVDSD